MKFVNYSRKLLSVLVKLWEFNDNRTRFLCAKVEMIKGLRIKAGPTHQAGIICKCLLDVWVPSIATTPLRKSLSDAEQYARK